MHEVDGGYDRHGDQQKNDAEQDHGDLNPNILIARLFVLRSVAEQSLKRLEVHARKFRRMKAKRKRATDSGLMH